MNEFTLREAKSFRPQIDMKKADKRPGYYKWWCPYDLMPTVLGKLDFKLEDAPLEIKEINGNKYYCIYIGIAVNEPLMKIGGYADTLSMEQAGVQIPTLNGTTVIDVDTAVKPTEMYIKYKSSK